MATDHSKQLRKRMLQAIIEYITRHGYPPTLREIGEAVGLHSSSAVHHHITWMIAEGMIETDDESSPRAIRIPGYEFHKKLKSESEM